MWYMYVLQDLLCKLCVYMYLVFGFVCIYVHVQVGANACSLWGFVVGVMSSLLLLRKRNSQFVLVFRRALGLGLVLIKYSYN